jgi:hypothetical protein
MEDLQEHIDRIILEKEYHQLSIDELAQIQEFIVNESEYNDFRHTLRAVRAQFANEIELEPSVEAKELLVAQFEQHQKTGLPKTTSSGITYFFPPEKQFFAKPGVQLLMAAAAIALLIGFVFNFSLDIDHNEVALDSTKNKEQSAPLLDELKEVTTTDKFFAETEENEISTFSKEDTPPLNTGIDNTSLSAKNKTDSEVNSTSKITTVNNEAEIANEMTLSPSPTSISSSGSGTSGGANTAIGSSAIYDDFAVASESNTRQMAKTSPDKKKATIDATTSTIVGTPKKSKTLSENAELIGYFYTTM